MTDAEKKFELVKRLFSEFPDGNWDGLDYTFRLLVTDDTKAFIDSLDALEMLAPGANRYKVGEEKEVTFLSQQGAELFIARSIDDLINHNIYKCRCPDRVILLEPFDSFTIEQKPSKFILNSYVTVVNLVSIFEDLADHEDNSSGDKVFIFLSKEKIEIPIRYSTNDLSQWDKYKDFANMFSEKMHVEQRRSVFKSVVFDALKNVEVEDRFSYFLRNFDRLVIRILQNYELYVSEFSFDKVRKKNKAEIAQHLVKINSVFSDVQNQLLTLPIAGLLAAGQMESGASNSLKNGSIVVAALSFALLLSFVLRNYFASLRTVKKEIDAQKNSLKEEYRVFAASFEEDYRVVDKRYRSQVWLGRVVDLAVSITLVLIPSCLFIYINNHDFVNWVLEQSFSRDLIEIMRSNVFGLIDWLFF